MLSRIQCGVLFGRQRLNFLPCTAHFEFVKTLTVHAYHVGLGNKSLGIYFVDDGKYHAAFPSLGHDKQHFNVVTGVEAVRLYHRCTAMREYCYSACYFLILVGYNKELYAASHRLCNLVDTKTRYPQHHIAVKHFFPIVKNKLGRADNHNIAQHHYSSQRNIAVFVHDSCNNVGSSC